MLLRHATIAGIGAAIFCTMLLTEPASAGSHHRHYSAPKISTPIVIDGVMDDPAWNAAAWTELYVLYGTLDGVPETATRAKIVWDDTYLYIGVEAEDHDIWATYTERDSPLWNENVLEVFIDPEGNAINYMEFEVSPLNTILDLWVETPLFSQGGPAHFDWDAAGLRTAVHIDGTLGGADPNTPERQDTDTGWSLEFALPWEDAAIVSGTMALPPEPGDTWRINLTRYDYRNGDRELSQWSPSTVDGAWHEPSEYGHVTFTLQPTVVEAASWANIKDTVK